MVLTLAERQVLIMALVLTRRPQDWASGEPIATTREAMLRHGPLLFGDKLTDWSTAFETLDHHGLLTGSDPCSLTPSGLEQAIPLRRALLSEEFGTRLVRSERSTAYGLFCERVFGVDLRQFSLLDAEQLEALREALTLSADGRILDVGCGNGIVTEHLADTTGAHLTGVDVAAPAIARARKRTRAKRDRLRFQVADFTGPFRIPAPVDCIMAIDTLYLADSLHDTLGHLLRHLEPGGRLIILASDVVRASDQGTMTPERTRMHRALSAHGLSVETSDFTANEHAIWRRQLAVAEEMTPLFEAEGNGPLVRELIREAARSLQWVETGRVRRYLYQAGGGEGGLRT